jgi:putative ABC transport system permease protein
MSPRGPLPTPLRWLLERILPPERRDDVLGDLAETQAARQARLDPRRTRLRLWREAVALLLWRASRRGVKQAVRRAHRMAPPMNPVAMMTRDLAQDVRFGTRGAVRNPGFALTALVVLGLGIGASTTVLTLVNHIFFQPPAGVVQPDRLLTVYRSWAPGQGGGAIQNPDFEYYRSNVSALDGLAASGGGNFVAAYSTGMAGTDQLRGLFVSDNYFDVLGVRPALGRFFRAEENASPGTHPVVVLSHSFWRRAFGADPNVVGRQITLNGISHNVVGVAPEEFRGISPFADPPDTWIPLAMFGALTRAVDMAWWEREPGYRSSWLTLVGRLAPGTTYEMAGAHLQALSDALTYPERGDTEGILVTRDLLYRPGQKAQLMALSKMLVAVVTIVMVIACANFAVLLLSRATTRTREMSIRAAMGAGRARLVRQLLAESVLLGVAGCAIGMALAYVFSDAAATLLPYGFATGFAPDLRVLAVAAVLAVAMSAAAGLVPAVHAAGANIARVIGHRHAATGRSLVRDALVVGQMALSLLLVAGAVLFARSFWTARTQDLGFEADNRLVLQVDLRSQGYTEAEGRAFLSSALERLRAMPGVSHVATSRQIPFQGDWSTDLEAPHGAQPNSEDGTIWIGLNAVSADYFETMGVDLVSGRPFDSGDVEGGTRVAVVNQRLAQLLWPGVDPMGRSISFGDDRDFQVVGIARDATYYALGEDPTTQMYVSVRQRYMPTVHFLIETSGPPADLAPAAQATLRQLDPDLAFGWVTTMDDVVAQVTARYKVSAVLVGLFSGLALLLAVAGLYGVVSFLVARRTRDIGVRMALGADRGRVAGEVLRSGLALAVTGVGLGLIGALLLRRFTASLLYQVDASDPWALIAAAGTLIAVAVAASFVPAIRATRVDPVEAIRTE